MLHRKLATTFILASLLPMVTTAEDGQDRARQFIVMGYQGLTQEAAQGQRGPYVNTLIDLLKATPAQQEHAIEQIKQDAKTYPNIMDFADHLLNRFTTVPPPHPTLAADPSDPALENTLTHLVKGMAIQVHLKTGESVSGKMADYDAHRLWIRTPVMKSFKLSDILAVDTLNR